MSQRETSGFVCVIECCSLRLVKFYHWLRQMILIFSDFHFFFGCANLYAVNAKLEQWIKSIAQWINHFTQIYLIHAHKHLWSRQQRNIIFLVFHMKCHCVYVCFYCTQYMLHKSQYDEWQKHNLWTSRYGYVSVCDIMNWYWFAINNRSATGFSEIRRPFWNTSPDCITVTSQWAQWRLKSPNSRLFTKPFIRV